MRTTGALTEMPLVSDVVESDEPTVSRDPTQIEPVGRLHQTSHGIVSFIEEPENLGAPHYGEVVG